MSKFGGNDPNGAVTSAANIKYHGLMNQGATCYLNSVLQVLFMTKDFRDAVERHTSKNPDAECIELHLTTLFKDLKQYDPVYTYKITKKLGIDNVLEQRDAAEFFEKILSLTSREASQIFRGELTHTNTCSVCGTETNTDGPFWHLPLALVDSSSGGYSVAAGIEKFFSTSELSGENQMYCEKCDNKADATLKSLMTHHPDVLMLQLKRFEFDYNYMAYFKVNCFVDIPCTLQIPENQTYELYAVVDHFGDLKSGHYTATIKPDYNEEWYCFNDANVSMPFQVHNIEKSQIAYLLFYRKKKMDAADTCTQDTSEMSTSGGLQLNISDNDKQSQVALKIKEKHESGEEVEVGNDTTEESRDMDRSGSDDAEDMGRKSGADDQAERREGQSVETHNEKISVTTYKEVGVEKQAKEQGKKGNNENIQNRDDSSPQQAGLAGRGRLTENQRVGSDEKTRHVNSQPKEKSGFNEDTMGIRDGTKQTNILYGKIIEEECKRTDSGIEISSVTSCKIFFFKINVKRKSDPKTELQDTVSIDVCNLNLNESEKHSTKRLIGSVGEGNETNIATDSNAKTVRVLSDAQAARIKHKSKK